MDNGLQALIVASDAEVGEVPLQHPAKRAMLLSDRPRPHEAALLVNRLERAHHTILRGVLPNRRPAPLRLAPYVQKAEERKGRRQRRFHTDALGRRSEVNQPGLVRVEFQSELRQPLAQHLMHPLGVFFAREQHDKVVAVANQGTGASQARSTCSANHSSST